MDLHLLAVASPAGVPHLLGLITTCYQSKHQNCAPKGARSKAEERAIGDTGCEQGVTRQCLVPAPEHPRPGLSQSVWEPVVRLTSQSEKAFPAPLISSTRDFDKQKRLKGKTFALLCSGRAGQHDAELQNQAKGPKMRAQLSSPKQVWWLQPPGVTSRAVLSPPPFAIGGSARLCLHMQTRKRRGCNT